MITIRRLYQYLVCFVALQVAAGALNALLGSVISWLTGAGEPDGFFVTLQLAVLIVAVPVFLGHWLWVLYLARRDPAERASGLYHLYLYATQAMFTWAVAWAVGSAVFVVTDFVLGRGGSQFAAVLQAVGATAVTVVLMGALGFYHYWLARRPDLAQLPSMSTVYTLYTLGWEAIGTGVSAGGLYFVLRSVLDLVSRRPLDWLALGLALLAFGLPLWLFHWLHRARLRPLAASLGDNLRNLLAMAFSAAGVTLVLFGLADVLTGAVLSFVGRPRSGPAYTLAMVIVGLALWAYHEWVVRRLNLAGLRPLRWLYAQFFSVVGLLAAVVGGINLLQWLLNSLRPQFNNLATGVGFLLPGLLVWGYHQWVVWRTGRALGLGQAEAGSFRTEGRFLQRLYLYVFSGAGVALTTLGLVGVQMALFTGNRGLFDWRESLAWLLVGLPLWLYHWIRAGRLFAAGLPDERRSDLRKIYLYLIIFAAVNTVIITAGLTLNGVFRALLNLPNEGQLGNSIAIIVAAVALWVYHALVLRSDIARAAESSLQGTLQRLYAYLVATFGLTAFLFGLAFVLSAVINWLAAGLRADEALRAQFASALASLIAGLPVWFLAWWPAQRAARLAGPAGAAARRSVLRRLYLYGFALAAVFITLISAISVVYQLLIGVFQLGGGNVLANIALGAGFAVIGAAVWLYHAWVLRQDGRHGAADLRVEAAKRTAEAAQVSAAESAQWAGFPVAVADDGDGRFAKMALAVLRRDLPSLRLLPVGLSPAAVAALAGEHPDGSPGPEPVAADKTVFATPTAERTVPNAFAVARMIVAPWSAVARDPIAGSLLPKIIVPQSGYRLYWVGLHPEAVKALSAEPGPALVATVKAALKRFADKPAVVDTPAPAAPSAPPADEPPPAEPPQLTNSPIPTTT